MKRLTRIFVASTIGGVALVANASMSFPVLDEMGLTALSDSEMSSMRGGFVSTNDSVINIGLSITTAINGETILSTHIADFTINNGRLVSQSGSDSIPYDDPVKYIAIGEPGTNINNAIPGSNSIGFIIQNTADGTHINTQTIMDIEADISGYTQQSIYRDRLENSILYSGY
ncbi:hypothetical protein [uncultured Photobacterium sp.]|uniref:hypothetical protein n=1 Tax=uncultured Photobacterium sp. TaxID=173973 RepID=UPI00261073D4|nr:hypothetical protein [uncultured Photobacterium sp.]